MAEACSGMQEAHDQMVPQGGRVRGAQDGQHTQTKVLDWMMGRRRQRQRDTGRSRGRASGDHVAGGDDMSELVFRAQAAGFEGSKSKGRLRLGRVAALRMTRGPLAASARRTHLIAFDAFLPTA